jgi:hypothetical protein
MIQRPKLLLALPSSIISHSIPYSSCHPPLESSRHVCVTSTAHPHHIIIIYRGFSTPPRPPIAAKASLVARARPPCVINPGLYSTLASKAAGVPA